MVRECKDDSTVHQREFPFARNPPQTRRKETEAKRHMKMQSNKSRTIISSRVISYNCSRRFVIRCCYVNPPCNFCSCSCLFTASCASFCMVSSFSSVTDFMGIILGLQRTGIGVCSVKRSPFLGRTSLNTILSPAIFVFSSGSSR